MTFRSIFNKELRDREIIFQNEGIRNVHERPYNSNGGKGQVMIVLDSGKSIEADVPMQPEGEPNLDKMA